MICCASSIIKSVCGSVLIAAAYESARTGKAIQL